MIKHLSIDNQKKKSKNKSCSNNDSNNYLIFLFFSGIVGVEIRQMHVPAEVESGSVPFVILDCDYDLAESESNQVKVNSRFELI